MAGDMLSLSFQRHDFHFGRACKMCSLLDLACFWAVVKQLFLLLGRTEGD
jgi:hypothetical protein